MLDLRPETFEDPLSVLAGMFPFIRGGASKKLLEASLKMECLIHERCTLPGSMVLADRTIREIVSNNFELVSSGALVLDLRDSAPDFQTLASIKFGGTASREVVEWAEYLDEHCPAVIRFDSRNNAQSYRENMRTYADHLRGKARVQRVKDELAIYIGALDAETELSLESAVKLAGLAGSRRKKLEAAARFHYCVTGAKFVVGEAQVPQSLWEYVHSDFVVNTLSVDASLAPDQISEAHATVLEYFAVSPAAFTRLSGQDIVTLKSEGATRQAIKVLRTIITVVSSKGNEELIPALRKDLVAARAEVQERVRQYCYREAQLRRAGSVGGVGIDEWASDIFPLAGLARKGILGTGRVVSRWSDALKWADFQVAPVNTYVSRLQSAVAFSSR